MKKTILYSLAFISLGLISGSIGPTLPALAEQTHSQLHEISSLFAFRSFGTMIGAMLIGRLYDRWRGHPLLGASLLGAAAAMFAVPSMYALSPLLLLSFLLGVSAGSINVGGNALIVLVHGERVRPFMSGLHFAFGLGGFMAPILFTQFLRYDHPLRITYWVLAAVTVPVALLVFRGQSPAVRHHEHHEAASAAPRRTLWLFLLFFFLEVGAEASIMGWYYSYASERGVTRYVAGWMNSGFWAAFTLGRLATIWLSLRFKAISVVLAQLLLATAVALVMLLAPVSPAMLWAGALGFGIAVAPIFPSGFGYAQRVVGLSGRTTSYFLVGSSAGGMFWPWLIGQYIQSMGPHTMTVIVLVDLIGALLLLHLLHRENAASAAETTDVTTAFDEGHTEPL